MRIASNRRPRRVMERLDAALAVALSSVPPQVCGTSRCDVPRPATNRPCRPCCWRLRDTRRPQGRWTNGSRGRRSTTTARPASVDGAEPNRSGKPMLGHSRDMTSNTDDDNVEIISAGRDAVDEDVVQRGDRQSLSDLVGAGQGDADRHDDQAAAGRGGRRRSTKPAAVGCATSTAPASVSSRRAWRRNCAPSWSGLRCRSPRTPCPLTPSCGSRRPSWSAGFEGLFHGIQTALFAQQMAASSTTRADAGSAAARCKRAGNGSAGASRHRPYL